MLLVDDSALSLGTLQGMLESTGDVEVVGQARDGEQALRETMALRPDAILLDLQMPRMDGFTFLRLLMAQRPTPVIVLSSNSRRGDVFRSLELGAVDFVAKPERSGLEAVREELLAKCAMVRGLRLENLGSWSRPDRDPADPRPLVEPARLAVIGASTGGPQALQEVLAALPGDLPLGVLVAQHMPEKFTRAFAERLGRSSALTVAEAAEGDLVAAGRVLIAPGGHHLVLRRERGTGTLRVALAPPEGGGSARYCPSIDRLFTSAALAMPRPLLPQHRSALHLGGAGHAAPALRRGAHRDGERRRRRPAGGQGGRRAHAGRVGADRRDIRDAAGGGGHRDGGPVAGTPRDCRPPGRLCPE
jgi:two-component system, chemotaxis family, protein-glutamate methylesterase/glutaminase